jgi:hypothetical protein
MAIKKAAQKALIYSARAIAFVLIVLMILVPDARVAVARKLFPGLCMTEELNTIPNLAGVRFDVTYTNCDTIAKENSVTVYASKAVVGRESLFAKWSNRKVPIFVYDPGRSETPSIEVSGEAKVLISVSHVSSIYSQSGQWRNVRIDYHIGHIYYPRESAAQGSVTSPR